MGAIDFINGSFVFFIGPDCDRLSTGLPLQQHLGGSPQRRPCASSKNTPYRAQITPDSIVLRH